MSDLRNLDYEQYIKSSVPGYIEIGNELQHIRTTLSASENLIQYGPQGIGKTLSYEYVAAKEGVPIIQFDCSKDTKRSHLVAQTTFAVDDDGSKKVEFIPGAIPKSIEAANEYGKAMLVLEEINCLPAGTPVLTPDGEVPIETLSPGDRVVSGDLQNGQLQTNQVLDAFSGPNEELFELGLSNGETLTLTGDHQIWTQNGWTRTRNIGRGTQVRGLWEGSGEQGRASETGLQLPGWVTIESVTSVGGDTVYNITVDGDRNYFANGVLVHNSLSPALQKMLNQVSDHRQAIEISESGEMVELDDRASLMVGGTMNPSGTFGGTFDLNRDLRSRFNELSRRFPGNEDLKDILDVNGVPKKIGSQDGVVDQITSFVEAVHSMVESDRVSYEFSPRDAVRLGIMWDKYYSDLLDISDKGMNEAREGLRLALETTVMGKFRDDQERSMIEDQVQDSFAVDTY